MDEKVKTDEKAPVTTPKVPTGVYNPVTVVVHETVGTVVLGLLSIILLIGWISSERRHRK